MMVVKNRHFTKDYPLVVSLLNPTREEEWTWYRNGPRLRSVSHGAKPDNAKQAGEHVNGATTSRQFPRIRI